MTVPVDPRAKAIEAMARAIYESRGGLDWGHTASQERHRAQAKRALAALEQEGLVLTDTREVERLREALQEIGRLSSYDGVKRARIIAHEALSCVPVEKESDA